MILEKFAQFNPIIQALLGTTFTYAMTALGAAGVFLGKDLNRQMLDAMMGFAAGVMIAASYCWISCRRRIPLAGGQAPATSSPGRKST